MAAPVLEGPGMIPILDPGELVAPDRKRGLSPEMVRQSNTLTPDSMVTIHQGRNPAGSYLSYPEQGHDPSPGTHNHAPPRVIRPRGALS